MKYNYLFFLILLFNLSACHQLTLANKPSSAQIITKKRANISTSNQVSLGAASALLSAGLTQESCIDNFDNCLKDINELFLNDNDDVLNKGKLSLLAELHYAHADHLIKQESCKYTNRDPIDPYYQNAPQNPDEIKQKLKEKNTCLTNYKDALIKTLNYSYGYLFYDDLTQSNTKNPFIQENDIKAQDLYHLSTNALINELYKQHDGAFAETTRIKDERIIEEEYHQIQASKYQSDHDSVILYLDNNPLLLANLQKQEQALADLVSAYDGRMKGLQTTSTRPGIGVSYVGVLEDRYLLNLKQSNSYDYDDLKSRIHPMGNMLLTAIARPTGHNLDEVLNSNQTNIYLFDPYQHQDIKIFDKTYPLSANFSASYALWLGENHLNRASIANMLKKRDVTLPELFMLEPYNPNKKVVIMVHGLASSPATWLNLTNNLLADPKIREHYQVWQIFYATNLPMLENRYQIQSLIEAAYHFSDPEGKNPASKNSVLIGHSMGGVISRMMVSKDNLLGKLDTLDLDDKQSLQQDTTAKKAQKLLKQTYHAELNNRFTLQSLPQVDTAIFISSPFRGTDYAERWFTLLARRIIRLPVNLTKGIISTVDLDEDKTLKNDDVGALYLQNGASQLSDRSAFMRLTQDIHIDKNVRYYNIMGDHLKKLENKDASTLSTEEKMAISGLSDGIVPYKSSHLDGAVREIIISGNHSLHENPQTVKELRKILHEHLKQLGVD